MFFALCLQDVKLGCGWIFRLGAHLPTQAHHLALAMLRDDYLTNEMLRQWGVDRVAAGQVPGRLRSRLRGA
jgi:hypothetical protein